MLLQNLRSATDRNEAQLIVLDRMAALQGSAMSEPESQLSATYLQSLANSAAPPAPETAGSSTALHTSLRDNVSNASSINAIRALESQVWCRQSRSCYPHRRECKCTFYMSYSELASINSDLGSSQLKWTYYHADTSIFLTTTEARKIIEFHVEHLWWHHNALYSHTFLAQCDKFWASGVVVHPLWLALYLSILGVRGMYIGHIRCMLMCCQSTVWTLENSPKQARLLAVGMPPQFSAEA